LFFTGLIQIGVDLIPRFSRVQEITDFYQFFLADPIGKSKQKREKKKEKLLILSRSDLRKKKRRIARSLAADQIDPARASLVVLETVSCVRRLCTRGDRPASATPIGRLRTRSKSRDRTPAARSTLRPLRAFAQRAGPTALGARSPVPASDRCGLARPQTNSVVQRPAPLLAGFSLFSSAAARKTGTSTCGIDRC
jgi:hypothetical protein